MLLEIHPENPDIRKVKIVAQRLSKGDIIIYPTDTVYGIGCDIFNQKAVERVCRIKKLNPEKANLTFICKDLSQLAFYVHHIDNQLFRTLKQNIPGAFTFILKANKEVPRHFKNKRKTVGIRVPNNAIAQAIIEELDRPILSISLNADDEKDGILTDPYLMHERFEKLVDIVIDGGEGGTEFSTVVDCSNGEIEIIREGKGELV